jgi:hypothetical protein
MGGGHVVVEMQLPSGKIAYAMLDSGAASFGVSAFSAADWALLTGDVPLAASDTVSEYSVQSTNGARPHSYQWHKRISPSTNSYPKT